tara:strand:- start:78 stop:350 length:273 start_codon:yes stop_codon:yes gene_type:complete
MFTTLLALAMLSCSPAGGIGDSAPQPVTLDETIERLDRMILTSEKMLEDLKKMNHNSEMIFRAVTGCPSDHRCEELKNHIEAQIDTRGEK